MVSNYNVRISLPSGANPWSKPLYEIKVEDTKALSNCSREGCNYVIDCVTCRKEGKVRRYYGESSRSLYQRGREHLAEIDGGAVSHPLVAHFWFEHKGEKQSFILRGTSFHKTAIERQVLESIRIEGGLKDPEELLNLKSEWAGSNSLDWKSGAQWV